MIICEHLYELVITVACRVTIAMQHLQTSNFTNHCHNNIRISIRYSDYSFSVTELGTSCNIFVLDLAYCQNNSVDHVGTL